MKLEDLQPLNRWLELEKEIHARSGLSVNVFDANGVRITDFRFWPNDLCRMVKDIDAGKSTICATAHMNLANEAARSGKPVIEECDAGLLKIVVPILAQGQFIGAVGACGLLLGDGEVDTFLVNKITEIPDETLEPMAGRIPAISREKAEALVDFILQAIREMVAVHAI